MLKVEKNADSAILQRIRANDRTVLGELYMSCEKMITSYILTHGGGNADADDILQESIVVLWQNACSGKLQLTARLSTYVMAIAKNKWRAQLRKKQRISNGEIPTDIIDEEDGAMEILLQDEQLQRVRQGLDRIHADCRKLLLLFYFEERSLQDIAGIMRFANPDVVKSKKYQCKKALEKAVSRPVSETGRKQ